MSPNNPKNRIRQGLDFCQKILPDISWAIFFFILSDATFTLRTSTSGLGKGGSDTYHYSLYLWIELSVLLILFSYFAQEKMTSGCLTRYLLSTKLSAAIGHSSYVTYLLQRPGIDIWGPCFSFFFQTGKWSWVNGDNVHWFEWTLNIWKICGIAVLLICTWLIQVYFQDVFVARVFMWLQTKWQKHWETKASSVNTDSPLISNRVDSIVIEMTNNNTPI